MKKYNFLITPLNGNNAGTEAFNSLKLTNIYNKVVGTDITEFSYARHVCDKFYVQPYASGNGYIDAISRIVKKERIGVIIPGSDYELRALAANREVFERVGVHLLANSSRVIDICSYKHKTIRFLQEKGFPNLKTEAFRIERPEMRNLFYRLREKLGCSFIIKPDFFTGGSNAISVIQDKYDWEGFTKNKISSKDLFIAQEYIDTPDKEYTVGVMSDTDGRLISSFALKRDLTTSASIKHRVTNRYSGSLKHRDIIISSGISQGLVGDYKRLRRFAEQVAAQLLSVGPINIQCRMRGNKIYIFEINPRFSGTTSIRALLGHNDVELIFYSVVKKINLGQQKYRFASVVRGRSVEYRYI